MLGTDNSGLEKIVVYAWAPLVQLVFKSDLNAFLRDLSDGYYFSISWCLVCIEILTMSVRHVRCGLTSKLPNT